MITTLIGLSLVSHLGMVLWVKRTIRQNEDRCEAKRLVLQRLG